MERYHDEDYEFFVYSINDIKTELGLSPHTRGGLLEKLLLTLEEEQCLMVLDWRIKNRDGDFEWHRMLTPSDTMTLIAEYYRHLPDKKQRRIRDTAEKMLEHLAVWDVLVND